jgi:hypothetical protein
MLGLGWEERLHAVPEAVGQFAFDSQVGPDAPPGPAIPADPDPGVKIPVVKQVLDTRTAIAILEINQLRGLIVGIHRIADERCRSNIPIAGERADLPASGIRSVDAEFARPRTAKLPRGQSPRPAPSYANV